MRVLKSPSKMRFIIFAIATEWRTASEVSALSRKLFGGQVITEREARTGMRKLYQLGRAMTRAGMVGKQRRVMFKQFA